MNGMVGISLHLLITYGKKYGVFFAGMESQRVSTQSKPFHFFPPFKSDLHVNSSGAKLSYLHFGFQWAG